MTHMVNGINHHLVAPWTMVETKMVRDIVETWISVVERLVPVKTAIQRNQSQWLLRLCSMICSSAFVQAVAILGHHLVAT
jgi:hypothetical protein